MSKEYSEDSLVEQATQDVLHDLGWEVKYAYKREIFGREKGLLGRADRTEIILKRDLLVALKRYNENLPEIAYTQAIEHIEQRVADKSLGAINKQKYEILREGVPVSYTDAKGVLIKKKLRIIDFKDATNNHFLAVRQLEINGNLYNRRPDVIGFVNGIPLVFFELKAHGVSLRDAYENNISDYKDAIPAVFHHNAFIILSNGTDASVGTVTSKYKFFLEWKRIEEDQEGIVSLDTMIRGTCEKNRLMDIFENFLLFDDSDGEIIKIMAKNHQFIGVNKVINQAKNIEDLQGKLGVFWHTQGSGKSYSIVFICEKIHRKLGGSYTFLIVADRTELETQLYDTFSSVGLVKNKDVKAKDREDLRAILKENNRYVFSLIQKFSIDPKKETEYPLITDRSNIIVISDEAHRTQNGTFAQNMRFRGIPNASYLGFTGTPLIAGELEQTKNIFGNYVSIYDFKRAIEDNATLPLKYINRGERLDIDNPDLDEEMATILENQDSLTDDQKRKLTYLFQKNYVILTAESRLDAIAKDLVWHFNERGYQGKAMLVALDKPTAVRMYDLMMKHWQLYLADLSEKIANAEDQYEEQTLKRKWQLVKETEVCVIVSPEQNEVKKFEALKLDIAMHRRKMVDSTRNLAEDFKDENHPFRLAIVCAMWITGFDAPCVSTIYLDKPIQGHTLMQTIARANRVYDEEKENGLIVDYGNVYKQLEKAYSIYGEGGKNTGGDGGTIEKPLELLIEMEEELSEAIKVARGYLFELGFELSQLFEANAMQKLALLKKAANCVCLNPASRVAFETTARLVFRKYKALFPEEQVKPHIKAYNAIEAIYAQLNQRAKQADVSAIIRALQEVVNESIFIDQSTPTEDVEIDLSKLDFEKLRTAFAKSERKNTVVFDLQEVIDNQLQSMIQENPLRMEFYERYQEIIEEYNSGKSAEDIKKAFDDLTDFMEEMTYEQARAIRENLDQETLAIFDLLMEDKELSANEKAEVKKVAKDMLAKLKQEKLRIDRWRESRQVTAQVKTMIYDHLQWLPSKSYSDNEVGQKSINVYQHVYTRYGAGVRV